MNKIAFLEGYLEKEAAGIIGETADLGKSYVRRGVSKAKQVGEAIKGKSTQLADKVVKKSIDPDVTAEIMEAMRLHNPMYTMGTDITGPAGQEARRLAQAIIDADESILKQSIIPQSGKGWGANIRSRILSKKLKNLLESVKSLEPRPYQELTSRWPDVRVLRSDAYDLIR
jgi:hypothetical protein